MDDYQAMYPPPGGEPPRKSEPEPPADAASPSAPPPAGSGAFYGDPTVPPQQPQNFVWQAPPLPPPEKPITMNRRIYTMCAVIAVLIFLLCVYCIGADVLHGALASGGADRPQIKVELQMQEKPDLNPDDDNVTADGEYTVRGVAEKVTPSIVQVYTYSAADASERSLAGTGSGIILSEDGYIVTNAHVVQGEAFGVTFGEDEDHPYTAELIGSDAKTDLAVLKIDAKNLTPAVLGKSSECYVGENVVAIGNPAGLTNTVTRGIVSAIGRQVRAESTSFRMECIQTDAAISPGNSGGALVNMYGQVIGITSSKYASMYASAYEGLGFAISIDQALPIIRDLLENGYVTGRYRIGIVLSSAGSQLAQEEFRKKYGAAMPAALQEGIWISEISEDCDIHNTELQPDDFILSMQGHKVAQYDDVIEALDGCKGGDTVSARCGRFEDGKVTYFDIEFKLEEDTSGNY